MQIPNCVPEYYRSLQEREEHEYEMAHKFDEYYAESKRRLKDAYDKGYPVLDFGGYYACNSCKKKFDVQVNADDDLCSLICYDKDCVCHIMERR